MRIPRNSNVELSVVGEDLEIEDGAKITCTGGSTTLVVRGNIECQGRAEFVGNVQCDDFEGGNGTISVTGSLQCLDLSIESNSELIVSKDIRADDVEVDKVLRIGGIIEAREIEVGGRFETSNAKAESVSVGGTFDAHGDVDAKEIEVGGKLEIGGKVTATELTVGGKAILHGGGKVSDGIEVGGFLTVEAPLEYGGIEVGGAARLGAAKGGDIEIGGTIEVEGDLDFADMEVGGYARIRGNALGSNLELGGELSIEKALKLSGSLEVGGAIEVKDLAEAEDVEIGGEFRAAGLRARNVELGGGARTERGIFASNDVRVRHRSNVQGWVRAMRDIEIESRSQVESVSAPRVSLENRCRAQNVYGDDVEIGDRVEVSGELMYTRTLETGDDVILKSQPERVSEIPQEKSWEQSLSE